MLVNRKRPWSLLWLKMRPLLDCFFLLTIMFQAPEGVLQNRLPQTDAAGIAQPHQGGQNWFEARYRTARCLGMLGNAAEGCQVLTATEVLYPAPRDEAYKQRFLLLQKELCPMS